MDNLRTAVVFTGGFCDTQLLDADEIEGDLILAADAGWITAQACGVTPHIVAGDFDSSHVPAHLPAQILRVPCEKDDTDTMLVCKLAIDRGARCIRIIGGTGGRIDHSLSNLFFLEALHRQGIMATLCDGQNHVQLLENESVVLPRGRYRYFSLIALGDASATLTGCKYPLHDAPLSRALPYAVSNEIAADAARISVRGAPVFLIQSGAAQKSPSSI